MPIRTRHRFPMHDIRGIGGNIERGYRTVQKGGFVAFDSLKFFHPILEKFVGHRVYVSDPACAFYTKNIKVEIEELNRYIWAINTREMGEGTKFCEPIKSYRTG